MAKNLMAQGDLLFIKRKEIPKGVRGMMAKAGRYVLAEGEVTGHNHTVVMDDNVKVYEDEASALKAYMEIMAEPAVVEHQEHKPVRLDPGIWEVRRQVNYTPGPVPVQRVLD